jgi:hypothetical protein
MVTKVTARIGLMAALGALIVAMPTSVGAAPAAHHQKGVGDHCLVGTWRARPAIVPVFFDGQAVDMHYGGGNYLHINRKGDQITNWNQSRLMEAFPNGLPLKVHNRGVFYAHIRGLEGTSASDGSEIHVLQVADGRAGSGDYIRATYAGHKVKFHYTDFRAHYDAYTCSKTALILMDGALNVHQTYDRRSYQP